MASEIFIMFLMILKKYVLLRNDFIFRNNNLQFKTMKYLSFPIFCLFIFFAVGCEDEEQDDLSDIDACEYVLPSYNTTQKFSNDLTTFELHFGPDTIVNNTNIIDQRVAILDDTDIEIPFGCVSSNGGFIFLGDGNHFINENAWEEIELFEGVFFSDNWVDYVTDDQLDARSWIEDMLDLTYLNPNGYPIMIPFGISFDDEYEDADGWEGVFGHMTHIVLHEPGVVPPPVVARIRMNSRLAAHLDQHEVNGIEYEDVILVEARFRVTLYPDFQYGDDSPVWDEVYNYWFAKGIGLIETTDRNFKLEE